MKKKTINNLPERVYLKEGDSVGNVGYTDLKLTKKGFILESTEGGELDFYDEVADEHYPVSCDMDGTPKSNKNFGKWYYEKN